jgi:hypothetical protein
MYCSMASLIIATMLTMTLLAHTSSTISRNNNRRLHTLSEVSLTLRATRIGKKRSKTHSCTALPFSLQVCQLMAHGLSRASLPAYLNDAILLLTYLYVNHFLSFTTYLMNNARSFQIVPSITLCAMQGGIDGEHT